MKQLSFLLLCTVMSAAAMENTNSTQPLTDSAVNTLSTQSTPYNLRNNRKRYSNGDSEFSSKKRKHQNLNNASNDNETASKKRKCLVMRKPSANTAVLKSILDDSPIEACKESLANATRYFLYIQCMCQNILYYYLKGNKDPISRLSNPGLREDQLHEIYEIIKLLNTKADGSQEVDGIKLWNLGEFDTLQEKIQGKNCKIGKEEGFKIFQLIYKFIINSNKNVENALDFCKYGLKNSFVYTTISYNWVSALSQRNNVPFYIFNYLAIITGKEIGDIEDTIKKPASSNVSHTNFRLILPKTPLFFPQRTRVDDPQPTNLKRPYSAFSYTNVRAMLQEEGLRDLQV